jgi:hypothetical protein
MPISFLSENERLQFDSFPADLTTEDLIAFLNGRNVSSFSLD